MPKSPPTPCVKERAGDPDPAGKLAQLAEELEKIQRYLRERGVEYALSNDEMPFAVLWPTQSADVRLLRELGEQLRVWASSNRGVKRILGLERLMEGRCPEVSVFLLMLPYSPTKPESWIEKAALVVLESGANAEGLTTSLCDLVERSGVAAVTSWEQYRHMNR